MFLGSTLSILLFAIPIDRVCSRQCVSSPPYQFASLLLAAFGDMVIHVLADGALKSYVQARNLPPLEWHRGICIALAALAAFGASASVYAYLRGRLRWDKDFDDAEALPGSDIADIDQA